MKLKKLEISGFKSFYEKSTLEFPPGISAVVGPNGCGKSNVVDAIRWVMGEQSLKQLRGKSKEDIIFSGTNGKPPLNMAEVSLTLANDNGNAPEELKDFTEINLTRRLYRSGESAYFLNRQPCRLKDIHNVFLGSGLGAKSYAVIQQGNIGAITEADPVDRRFFIEEAAGTTRYKNRKTEALRKVEKTQQNLLRVNDIIVEIKRQMASLKRQARKAEMYKNLQQRIQTLDVCLGVHYYDDISAQIEQAASVLQQLKDADIGHSSELKKLDAAVEDIKLKRWQKNQQIAEQKSSLHDSQREIDRLENDLVHLREEIERLSREIAELSSASEELSAKNDGLTNEISLTEQENDRLKREIGDTKRRLSEKRQNSEHIRTQLAELNRQLESAKADLMGLVTREAQYKNIYQNAANNKESLERRLKHKDEEAAAAQGQINAAARRETRTREQLEAVKQEIGLLDEQIEVTRTRLAEKAAGLADQVKLAQGLELELSTAASKYATLKKMEDNFEWYRDGVKAVMRQTAATGEHAESTESASSNRLKGIISLMADVIEAEPSFETAVEAALGEALQYIIVENQQAGASAIDYLQSHDAGRSGFVPLDTAKLPAAASAALPDPSRLLLRHISVKPGFEAAAQALLGHVVIAEDIGQALQWFNANGSFQQIVTKNGDLVSHHGILMGGSRDRLNGILAKKKELKTLAVQIKNLNQKLEKARDRQTELEEEVRGFENSLQKQIERKNRAAENEMEAEKALYRAGEDLKNARRHLEIVQLEQEQLLGEASDLDDEMGKYNTALSKVADEIKAAQQRVSELSQRIEAVSERMEQFEQSVVDLKLKLTALDARLENSTGNLQRLRDFHQDAVMRLEQLSREIRQKQHRREASQVSITANEQKLSQMYEAVERLQQEIEHNEADYQAIDSLLADSDSKISKIRSQREKTLEKFRMLELEQSQMALKRDNIASRLEERYRQSFAVLKAQFHESQTAGQITAEMTFEQMETELAHSREKIARIVDVNLAAIKEYEQLKERYDFLKTQRDDLLKAIEDLQKVIKKINTITQQRFMETFNRINEKLGEVFPRLFEGGEAKLVLVDPDKPLESGVEFMVHPPGKKLTRLSLLSGGEKALSAIAFIFSIFLIKPASFCLLDEIDAPLDEANIYRFNDLLQLIGENSQIIVITHNKRTMEFAEMLFGITMEQKGVSKVVSVNFQKPGQPAENEPRRIAG